MQKYHSSRSRLDFKCLYFMQQVILPLFFFSFFGRSCLVDESCTESMLWFGIVVFVLIDIFGIESKSENCFEFFTLCTSISALLGIVRCSSKKTRNFEVKYNQLYTSLIKSIRRYIFSMITSLTKIFSWERRCNKLSIAMHKNGKCQYVICDSRLGKINQLVEYHA